MIFREFSLSEESIVSLVEKNSTTGDRRIFKNEPTMETKKKIKPKEELKKKLIGYTRWTKYNEKNLLSEKRHFDDCVIKL